MFGRLLPLRSMPSPSWNLFRRRRATPPKVQPSETSFWLAIPTREGFTAAAQQYFDDQRPPQTAQSMTGVTLQHAARNGTL